MIEIIKFPDDETEYVLLKYPEEYELNYIKDAIDQCGDPTYIRYMANENRNKYFTLFELGAQILGSSNTFPIMNYVLKSGFDINHQDNKGNTAIISVSHYANSNYNRDMNILSTFYELLLSQKNIDVNIVNNKGSTAIMTAAKKRCYYIIKRLVELGADINLGESNIECKDIKSYMESDLKVKETILKSQVNAEKFKNIKLNKIVNKLIKHHPDTFLNEYDVFITI